MTGVPSRGPATQRDAFSLSFSEQFAAKYDRDQDSHLRIRPGDVKWDRQWRFSTLRNGIGPLVRATLWSTDVLINEVREDTSLLSKEQQHLFTSQLHLMLENRLRLLTRIRHPNVVIHMGACLQKSHIFTVQELCTNGTMYHLLHESSEFLTSRQIVQLCLDTCRGMSFLHNQHAVIHGALSSQNLWLDSSNRVKVAQFGLCRIEHFLFKYRQNHNRIPKSLMSMRKLSQMGSTHSVLSPNSKYVDVLQQWQPGMVYVDPKVVKHHDFSYDSDVYSFGVLMLEMWTRVFPKQPLQSRDWFDPFISNLVQTCLHEDPNLRPTFHSLSIAFNEILLQSDAVLFERMELPRILQFLNDATNPRLQYITASEILHLITSAKSRSIRVLQHLLEHGVLLSLSMQLSSAHDEVKFACLKALNAFIIPHSTSEEEWWSTSKDASNSLFVLETICHHKDDELQWTGITFVKNLIDLCNSIRREAVTHAREILVLLSTSPDLMSHVMSSVGQQRAQKALDALAGDVHSLEKTIQAQQEELQARQRRLELYTKTFVSPNRKSIDDKYETKAEIGCGNFSRVLYVKRRETGDRFAMKVFDLETKGLSSMEIEAIENEYNILSTIHHPHIIAVEDFLLDLASKHIYFVLELATHGDMFDWILKRNLAALPEQHAVRMCWQIASAVSHLHSYGILHRDLKPDNILISDENIQVDKPCIDTMNIKLADFGFARFVSGLADHNKLKSRKREKGRYTAAWFHEEDLDVRPRLERATTDCGTLGYSAPELLHANEDDQLHEGYDEKVDVWSMGVIFYILLVGYPPFCSIRDDSGNLIQERPFWMFLDEMVYMDDSQLEFQDEIVQLSDNCKDLLRSMLRVSPRDRIASHLVASHPWFGRERSQSWSLLHGSMRESTTAQSKMRTSVAGLFSPCAREQTSQTTEESILSPTFRSYLSE